MDIKPEATMHGIAINPTNPSLHSNTKASIIPAIIVEQFMTKVDTNDVASPLTCHESIPNLVAAEPPRFLFI